MPRKKKVESVVKYDAKAVEGMVAALEAVQDQCQELSQMPVGPAKMVRQGLAMQQLRDVMMRPDVQQLVMSLKNTPVGFKTDERPGNPKYNQRPVEYKYTEIVDCVIIGMMNGVFPIQNQMNVISRQCYITKEGLEYKLDNDPVCIDNLESHHIEDTEWLGFDQHLGVATIKIRIAYKIKGSDPENKDFKVQVKFHERTGSIDQAIGKAKRKAWAWLYERVTGAKVPDGDVEPVIDHDAIEVEAEVVEEQAAVEPLTDEQQAYVRLLLSADCFTDATRDFYEGAFVDGDIHQQNYEEKIGKITGQMVAKNYPIPKREA